MIEKWKPFQSVLKSYYEVSDSEVSSIIDERALDEWNHNFRAQITDSKLGYPRGEVYNSPVLEDQLHEIAKDWGLESKAFADRPTLCLTHDIDYLLPTWQLKTKTWVGRKTRLPKISEFEFLESIETYFRIEEERLGKGQGHSTLFIASPVKKFFSFKRFQQMIIDPSYELGDEESLKLRDLVKQYSVNVGVHGSLYSLSDRLLKDEIKTIEDFFQQKVTCGRQHWLHMPELSSLEVIAESGLRTDSSLGWNGVLGFRGGVTRPYNIQMGSGAVTEVPMLIMDGVLFDELGLSEQEAFERCVTLLTEVKKRKGCVSLSWHGRTFSKVYGWGDLYKRVLDWALEEGFDFEKIEKVGERFQGRL